MPCLSIALEGYTLDVLTFFLLIIPAALYAMGMMEGRMGRVMPYIGVLAHIVSIVARYGVTCRLPLAEKHDNISFWALVTALAFLYARDVRGRGELSVSALLLAPALMMVAAAHRTIDTVSPFMETPWFYAHVFFYFVSYGLLGVSACAGGHYLLSGVREQEALQHQLALYGWLSLCASLLAGSIWFYLAYGTYWLWTSKELWITVTWLYMGMYLHVRMMPSLMGRPAAAIGIIGFLAAVFTYFGVGTIIPSPPAQF